MGIAVPGSWDRLDKNTISAIPGVGIGKVGGFAAKEGFRIGQSVVSKLFQQGLKTRSRAAGTGAGIGLGVSTQFDTTGSSPTTGDEQQGDNRFYPVSSYRRQQYRGKRSYRSLKLRGCYRHMPSRCSC